MSEITKDSFINNIMCILRKNGVEISSIIRKIFVPDDSELGFHVTNRYEVTIWKTSYKPRYKVNNRNKGIYNSGEIITTNIPLETISFFSKQKYSLYLIELLKKSQASQQLDGNER